MTYGQVPECAEIETLRAHWRADRERADAGRRCPDDAELFDAAGGGLEVGRRREIIGHTARCGACAESWRVAAELHRARPNVNKLPRRGSARFTPAWPLAAAAAISLALGLAWLIPANTPDLGAPGVANVFRGKNEFGVQVRTENGARMPRRAVVLDWAPVDGAREYFVVVRDAEMNAVFADPVEAPRLRLPPERLGELDSEATLYWYVEAVLESGKRPRSETRTLIIEG